MNKKLNDSCKMFIHCIYTLKSQIQFKTIPSHNFYDTLNSNLQYKIHLKRRGEMQLQLIEGFTGNRVVYKILENRLQKE